MEINQVKFICNSLDDKSNLGNHDKAITSYLEKIGRPASSIEVSLATGISHSLVCRKLKTLRKFNLVKKVTAVSPNKIGFYVLKGDKND